MLVKNTGLKGKHKLADKWKPDIYIVTDQPNKDILVYKVRPEDGSREKMLHRNMLLPLILPWPQERREDVEVESGRSDDESSVSEFEVQILADKRFVHASG